MAASGENDAQRNEMNAPTPSNPLLSTNTGPNFRQSGLQGGAQTTWNPASHYMFIQWYYQYYYQMINYYSQLHNWQMYMSSQSGSLTPTFSQSAAGPGLQPVSAGQNTAPQFNQHAAQTAVLHAQADSCEARIGTIPRRVMAELIDFVFLYFTKFLTFSLFYNDMDQGNQLYYTLIIDEDTTLADLEGFVVQALTYRFLVLAYEVFFLIGGFHGSLGGATPGKYLMGLSVVSANQVHTLAVDQEGERVQVMPGRNLGLWRAFIRATIKNFSVTFLFPVCLTMLFFQHNRTIYDIIAGSAVVTSTGGVTRRQQQQQRH